MQVEIDRHILRELITNVRNMKKNMDKIDKLYNETKELFGENNALLKHLVGEIKLKEGE